MNRIVARISVFGVALALLATAAYASPITYAVNRTIGVGTVVGSIQTDGTIGTLGTANILDWTLTLNDGTGPFTILGPSSGNNSQRQVNGSSFVGSATGLFFDFSNSVGALVIFQNPSIGSSINFWCMDGVNNGCAGNYSAETVTTGGTFAAVFAPRDGVVQVAGASAPAVPEPATLLLFGTGLVGLRAWRKRRQ